MVKAVRVHKTGGPEAMTYEDIEVGAPGQGELLVRHTAIGVNFIDTYFRSGLYPAQTPFVPGNEAAGVVEAVGAGVSDFKPGDRIAYVTGPGAYVEKRIVPADRMVKIPAGVSDKQAASMMLKGMTAQYLLRRTYKVQPGDTILFHAAAGGVGLIACQWARHLGATTIGTVGSKEKAALASAHGCHHPVLYRETDFVAAARAIVPAGVPVVYDSVGKDTFLKSLDCLRPLGLVALFGQSSGPVEPFNTGLLAQKGSLYITRPTLFTYIAQKTDLVATAAELFDVVAKGIVKIETTAEYALKDVVRCHQDLEGRKTTGSVVLIP
ncbi:MAG: NADPH:quinone reductase [Alphaproteobacteria bacterium]|nr:NADPH:quinone reductase [Alphaproteobacteria bacterium]